MRVPWALSRLYSKLQCIVRRGTNHEQPKLSVGVPWERCCLCVSTFNSAAGCDTKHECSWKDWKWTPVSNYSWHLSNPNLKRPYLEDGANYKLAHLTAPQPRQNTNTTTDIFKMHTRLRYTAIATTWVILSRIRIHCTLRLMLNIFRKFYIAGRRANNFANERHWNWNSCSTYESKTRSASLSYTKKPPKKNMAMLFLVATANLLCLCYVDLVVKCCLLACSTWQLVLITANHKPLVLV